jgi:hypothetical protein
MKQRPTRETPLVYNLFGRLNDPDNVTITEDDYFDFLISIGEEKNVARKKRRIPDSVYGALTKSSLLFLGFRVHQWDFRVLFRTLMSLEGRRLLSGNTHVAVQIDPDDDYIMDPKRAKMYLENLFKFTGPDVSIFWGSPEDFLTELHSRIPSNSLFLPSTR